MCGMYCKYDVYKHVYLHTCQNIKRKHSRESERLCTSLREQMSVADWHSATSAFLSSFYFYGFCIRCGRGVRVWRRLVILLLVLSMQAMWHGFYSAVILLCIKLKICVLRFTYQDMYIY